MPSRNVHVSAYLQDRGVFEENWKKQVEIFTSKNFGSADFFSFFWPLLNNLLDENRILGRVAVQMYAGNGVPTSGSFYSFRRLEREGCNIAGGTISAFSTTLFRSLYSFEMVTLV